MRSENRSEGTSLRFFNNSAAYGNNCASWPKRLGVELVARTLNPLNGTNIAATLVRALAYASFVLPLTAALCVPCAVGRL
jgi:hypothetical protein